ncbi:hypothetical protein [Brevibacillus choshinensis]|uniref:Uncharacterized protein n=1 Tax=Brevibacillus choshinensis TaxID=54911 RepID=A0ABX7FPS3_BRECH|nr:hypothetical protein [Brevibacillus choshinensis]QRG68081.1 hypothetical protein JNE38_02410 [Brevibacillus choshinensis]
MEDFLLLLSLEDFFALLALFVGCFTSIFYLRRSVTPRNLAIEWHQSDAYQPGINPGMVETYPMAARQPLRTRMFRRMQHADGEADTYDHLIFG